MPHLILSHSKNLKKDFKPFFVKSHEILATNLAAKIKDCRSRSIIHEHYHIGEGKNSEAFVHLDIYLKPGRAPESLKFVGQLLLALLHEYLAENKNNLNLQVSLEIREVGQFYFK